MSKKTQYPPMLKLLVVFVTLLGSVKIVSGQERSAPNRLNAERARQALMHTSTARAVRQRAQPIPNGYRLAKAKRTQFEEALTPFAAPVEATPVFESAPLQEMPMEIGDSWGTNDVFQEEGCGGSCGMADCGGSCDGGCTGTCGGGCGDCDQFGMGGYGLGAPGLSLQNLSVFAGTQGFLGPPSFSSGSFGFHYGANLGLPFNLLSYSGMGVQVGYRGVSSNYNGTDFTNEQRNQSFVTLGMFRRASVGFQGGLVVDIQRDSWYDAVDLSQLRGEISYRFPSQHEWGYWFTSSNSDDTSIDPFNVGQTLTWDPTDLHLAFYRRHNFITSGGVLRLMAGFTGNRDGLVGTQWTMPMGNALALQTDWMYLIPEEATGAGGNTNESWNISLSLVWKWGKDACSSQPSCYSPLFDVAGNGSFMVDQN